MWFILALIFFFFFPGQRVPASRKALPAVCGSQADQGACLWSGRLPSTPGHCCL